MRATHLKLIDTDSGEITEADGCPRCEALQRDLELAEKDLATKRRTIKSLQGDKTRARKEYARREEVVDCFNHWAEVTGHSRSKMSDDRFDVIKARLEEGYSVDQVKLAFDGLAAFPYVVNAQRKSEGSRAQKFDDVEHACSKGSRLERLANLGWEARRAAP